MPRKRKGQPQNYYKAFPTALRSLIKDRGITQQVLAEQLGKSRQAISYYCDGSSSPDWETIVQIANYFSVSTDYLLGCTDVESQDIEIQAICSTTGLCEDAVLTLAAWNNAATLKSKATTEDLSEYEAIVFRRLHELSSQDENSVYRANDYLQIIQLLIVGLSQRASELLDYYNAIITSEMVHRRTGLRSKWWNELISEEQSIALTENGFTVVADDVAKEINWNCILKIMRFAIESRIKSHLDDNPELWAETDDKGDIYIPLI